MVADRLEIGVGEAEVGGNLIIFREFSGNVWKPGSEILDKRLERCFDGEGE